MSRYSSAAKSQTAEQQAKREQSFQLSLKLTVLSSAMRAREAKLITPEQAREVLLQLIQGYPDKAAYLIDSYIMSTVSNLEDEL